MRSYDYITILELLNLVVERIVPRPCGGLHWDSCSSLRYLVGFRSLNRYPSGALRHEGLLLISQAFIDRYTLRLGRVLATYALCLGTTIEVDVGFQDNHS